MRLGEAMDCPKKRDFTSPQMLSLRKLSSQQRNVRILVFEEAKEPSYPHLPSLPFHT